MHSPTSPRVLVVDDEVALMTALCEMLEEQAYDTVGCVSGEQALGILLEREVDLLITDLMIPGMDGITLLRQAREIHPYLVGIVATGHGTIETAVDAMKVGAFDYVLKPFKLSTLLPILARAVEVGRLQRDNLQLRETVTIYELSQAVTLTLDPASVLDRVAAAALQQCEADAVSVMVPTPSGDALAVAVVHGSYPPALVGARVSLDQDVAAWVDRYREPLPPTGSVPTSPFEALHRPAATQSVMSLPMLAGGRLVGVLNVGVDGRHRGLTLGQRKALTILTSTAAAALENAFLYEQVREEERARLLALERAARAEAEVEHTARLAAEEALAIRDEFLSVAAHELKTPLTGLQGAVQLLLRQRERGLTPRLDQMQRVLQIIDRQAAKLGRLVIQLLETSRIEAGRFVPDRSLVDLTSLVSTVVEQARAMTSQHDLVLSAPPRLSARVDVARLQQVVTNLLDNAIKFSPDGGQIDVELSTPDPETARLAVRDRGIGIPMEYRPQLFNRYSQAHADSHRSGLGLGLYISRRIVELHGGHIDVEFPADGGTRFVVHLPTAAGAAVAQPHEPTTV